MAREHAAEVSDLLVHADWLRRLATRLVSEGDAEDAIQDTWVAAISSPPVGDAMAARPWLGEVLRNFVRRRWRSGALLRKKEEALRFEAGAPPTPDQLVERGQVQRQLAELVLALEEPFRSAVLLRFYEGQTAAAIARSLGVPAGTVRWRLSEGLSRLRVALDERHGGARETWRALVLPLALSRKSAAPLSVAAGGAAIMATGTKVVWTAMTALVVALLVGVAFWRWGAGRGVEAIAPVQTVDREARRRSMVGLERPEGSAAPAAASIEATVKDPGGRAVSGAMVTLTRAPAFNGTPDDNRPVAAARADAGGRVRFESALPGRYQLGAANADWMAVVSPVFGLQPSEQKRIDLTFRPGGELLEGRVLDEGGGPVAGARVTLTLGYPWTAYLGMAPGPKQPPRAYQALADEEGRYRVRLEPREYELRAEAAGYVPLQTTAAVTRRVIRDVVLRPAARVWGRVVERATGRPVPSVNVVLSPVQMMSVGYRQMVANDEGHFEFTDAEPGSFQLSVRDAGLNLVGSVARVTLIPLQTVGNVDILVDPGATVSGKVVGPDGRFVKGAVVGYGGEAAWGPGALRQLTGTDGSFELAGMTPGRYRLFAESSAAGWNRAESNVVVPAEGVAGVTLKLGAPEGLVMVGQVVRSNGSPAPDVLVRAEREGIRSGLAAGATETGADGSFQMSLTSPARLRVNAWHPEDGLVETVIDVSSAASRAPVELRLQPGAAIGGTVKWSDGAPAAGISVAVTRQEGMVIYDSATSSENGRFQIDCLAEGRYTVQALRKLGPWNLWTSREEPWLRLIDVRAGERRLDVELVVPRGGKRISGIVSFKDGRPAVGTQVIANREENGRSWKPRPQRVEHSGSAGEDGRFLIDDVEEGVFTLWAVRPGSPEAQLGGVAAGRNDVRITLQGGASVLGVVVGGDGRPVGDFSIQALPARPPNETLQQRSEREGASRRAERLGIRDPAGAFEISGLSPGHYELTVTTEAGGAIHPVNVSEGERKSGVRVVVGGGARVTGKVVEHASGVPLAGLRVTSGIAGRWLEAKTNAQGEFELTGVLPGEKAQLRVQPEDPKLIPEDVTADLARGQNSVNVGTIRLLRGDWLERMRDAGTIGLRVGSDGGHMRVLGLRAGSPAERAGIKTGQSVLAIDGTETSGLGVGAAHYLMSRKPGGTVSITLASPGGGPQTVKVTAEKAPR